MGTSKARRARRAAEQRETTAAPTVPEEPTVPAPAPEPPRPVYVPRGIDFRLPPGVQRDKAATLGRTPPVTARTAKLPRPVNTRVNLFLAEAEGRDLSFQEATLALWRALLREEHEMLEKARKAEHETGQQAVVRSGPLRRALARELDEMRAERNEG